jgi:hypothetical protein
MLLACIRSHLKSVLKNKFSILDTYHPDTPSLREKVRISGYFSKPKWVRKQKRLGNSGIDHYRYNKLLEQE